MLSGWLSQCSPTLLSFPAIITHFNTTQPWRQPSAGPLSAGFRMSGVSVQSTHRDTGMCTKAVTAFYCCQCWRLSSPQKSQLAHCGCLIFNSTAWLLFPHTLNRLWIKILGLQKDWQGMWICESKNILYSKGWSLMHSERLPQQYLTRPYSLTVLLAFTMPDCWWDTGFMDPISNRRKWVRFVALELWEQINRMLIREVKL